LPRSLPEALIEGLEWDVSGVVCESLSDVYAYGARVAGAVGAMMTILMGARDPRTVARACDLGVAMQLTNIARDVGEDARNNRLYLPRTWMREEGIDPDAWLAAPVSCAQIGKVVERLLHKADELYTRAESGIAGLPLSCRPAIFAARHLYHGIGVEVARNGFDSVSVRARVPGMRKLGLMSRALADAARSGVVVRAEPALAETQFLVDAVTDSQIDAVARRRGAEKVLWVAELFAELGERNRAPRVRA
jgi:phytoene synthase